MRTRQVVGLIGIGLLAAGVATAAFVDSTKVNMIYMPGTVLTEGGNAGGVAANLLNKYVAGYWNFNGGSSPGLPWLQLDLGTSQHVNEVRWRQYPGQEAPEYRLWVGDNPGGFTAGNETVHHTGGTTTVFDEVLSGTPQGRYVRVQLYGLSGWYNCSGLSVYTTETKQLTPTYPVSEIGSNGATVQAQSGQWGYNWLTVPSGGEQGLAIEHKAHDFDNYDMRTWVKSDTGAATMKITLNNWYALTQAKLALYVGGWNSSWSPPGVKIEVSSDDVFYLTVVDDSYGPGDYSDNPSYALNTWAAKYIRFTIPQKNWNSGQSILYRTDFFGTPMPEPAGVMLWLVAVIALARRRVH